MEAKYQELTPYDYNNAQARFEQIFNRIAKKYPNDVEMVRIKNTNITWAPNMCYEIIGNEKPPRLKVMEGVTIAFQDELTKEFKRLFRV